MMSVAVATNVSACPRCGSPLRREPASHLEALGDYEMSCLICGACYPCRQPDTASPGSANRSAALSRIKERRSRPGSITDRQAERAARKAHLHRTIAELAGDGLDPRQIGAKVGLTARSVRRHLDGDCMDGCA